MVLSTGMHTISVVKIIQRKPIRNQRVWCNEPSLNKCMGAGQHCWSGSNWLKNWVKCSCNNQSAVFVYCYHVLLRLPSGFGQVILSHQQKRANSLCCKMGHCIVGVLFCGELADFSNDLCGITALNLNEVALNASQKVFTLCENEILSLSRYNTLVED